MGGLAEPVEGVGGEPLGRPFGLELALAPEGGVGRPLGVVDGLGARPWSAVALVEGSVVAEGVVCTLGEEGVLEADANDGPEGVPVAELVPVPVPVPCGARPGHSRKSTSAPIESSPASASATRRVRSRPEGGAPASVEVVCGSRLSVPERGACEARPGGNGLGESTRGSSPLLRGSCTPGKLPPLDGACTGISPLGEDPRSNAGNEPLP